MMQITNMYHTTLYVCIFLSVMDVMDVANAAPKGGGRGAGRGGAGSAGFRSYGGIFYQEVLIPLIEKYSQKDCSTTFYV